MVEASLRQLTSYPQLFTKIEHFVAIISTVMATQSVDFFAVPKAHHHVSRLLVLVLILVVLVGVAWVITYFFGNRIVTPVDPLAGAKAELIARLKASTPATPPSPEQVQALVTKLAQPRSVITDTQKQALIDQLKKQTQSVTK